MQEIIRGDLVYIKDVSDFGIVMSTTSFEIIVRSLPHEITWHTNINQLISCDSKLIKVFYGL